KEPLGCRTLWGPSQPEGESNLEKRRLVTAHHAPPSRSSRGRYARASLPPAPSFPHALWIDSFLHWGWTGRQTFPVDVYILPLGASQPFFGLHVNALQGGHLPINGGLDTRDKIA